MPVTRFCEVPHSKPKGVFMHPALVKLGEEICADYIPSLIEAIGNRVYWPISPNPS